MNDVIIKVALTGHRLYTTDGGIYPHSNTYASFGAFDPSALSVLGTVCSMDAVRNCFR